MRGVKTVYIAKGTLVEVTLRLTVGQSVSWYWAPLWLATRYYFLSECCCLKFAVLCLSDERKDPAICRVINQWSESRRTRNHILLPLLRLFEGYIEEFEVTLRLMVGQSVSQVSQSVRSVSQWGQSVRSISQSVSQSVGQPVRQSVSQSVSK
jgi:hypothetical protein